MAKKKGAGKEKKGKKEKVKKPAYKRSSVYEKAGDGLKRKNKSCPKCGPGTFLANHKDRTCCGKCGYTEKK